MNPNEEQYFYYISAPVTPSPNDIAVRQLPTDALSLSVNLKVPIVRVKYSFRFV